MSEMSLAWITAVALLAVAALVVLLRLRTAPPQVVGVPFRIDYDDTWIRVTDNLGARRQVRWDELERVAIRTGDDRSTGADILWGLQTPGSDDVLVFAEGAAGQVELVNEMTRRLPGFNHDEVIHAMGTTSRGLFVVWEKECEPTMPAADAGDA